MIRLVALTFGLTVAACSSETTQPQPSAAALWPAETPTAAVPRPRPKAAPAPARVKVAAKKKAPPRKAKSTPKRQRVAVPWWCVSVPAGTSIKRMQAEAKSRDIPWTAQAKRQAAACLASK